MEHKILVVEDNRDNRDLLIKILENRNYSILEAESGEDAVRIAREELPELILMDVGLKGMDGLTATAHIKKDPATAHIPIIALTAYAMVGDRERTLEAGCDGYIPKPIDVRRLPGQIAEFMKDQGK